MAPLLCEDALCKAQPINLGSNMEPNFALLIYVTGHLLSIIKSYYIKPQL